MGSQFSLEHDNINDVDIFNFDTVNNMSEDIVDFEDADERTPLTSPSTFKTLFGSISKWLTDLKAVCFSGSYNDLINKPDLTLKANQSDLNTTNSNLATLATTVGTKAGQDYVDVLNTNIDILAGVSGLHEKADKTALNTTNSNLATLTTTVGTKASQSDLNVLKGTSGLYEKANKSAVDALSTTVQSKANQSSLNTTNSNLATLTTTVGTKASLTSFNNLAAMVNAIIAGVDTAVTNLSTLALSVNKAMLNISDMSGEPYGAPNLPVKANLSYVNNLFTRRADLFWYDYDTHSLTPESVIGYFNNSKPLYGRTMFIPVLSSTSGARSYGHYIDNVDMIINGSGSYCYNGITYAPIPFISIATIDNIGLTFNTTNVNVIVGKNLSAYAATIFIEYTKTTD